MNEGELREKSGYESEEKTNQWAFAKVQKRKKKKEM